MSDQANRQQLDMGTYPGALPEVGAWLWGMEAVRQGTLGALERMERAGLGQEFLDWRGPGGTDNSVATILYHVAHVEVGWLYYDMLMTGFPDDMQAIVPIGGRDDQGRLPHVAGLSYRELREKLALTRQRFLEVMSGLTREQWHAYSAPEGEDYAATPAWITFHLLEHEAGHLFEVRRMARKWGESRR